MDNRPDQIISSDDAQANTDRPDTAKNQPVDNGADPASVAEDNSLYTSGTSEMPA
ncbi:hypothetical protein SAMN04488502_101827 [Dendrosporobacter quercicolus]|uniref:Uncharacterized protein n=2 Tax=Dendrosporobacter quercicolus TaxID=146817 RepID=A0A1G9MWZ6_9FIRM|nr:hypothetical protein SAMN04488502_101827 [Dendrosporobacter quercicolus]